MYLFAPQIINFYLIPDKFDIVQFRLRFRSSDLIFSFYVNNTEGTPVM